MSSLTSQSFVVIPMSFFEFLVQVFTDFDVLEHASQLIHIVSRHSNILFHHTQSQNAMQNRHKLQKLPVINSAFHPSEVRKSRTSLLAAGLVA